MNILLFGGTTEGRALSHWLLGQGVDHTVSVATAYGAALLPAGVPARVGRLDQRGMEELLRTGGFTHVVDATHPYAVDATRTIRAACARAGVPCLRLLREGGGTEGDLHAATAEEAGRLLEQLPGRVLLTTGSKELAAFAAPGLRERCCPRVLPAVESLEKCLSLGFPPGQIICMQGPFTHEMNLALLRQYQIQILVTKVTGAAGGFGEKVSAARAAGCTLLVIDRPEQGDGLGLEELKEYLRKEVGE